MNRKQFIIRAPWLLSLPLIPLPLDIKGGGLTNPFFHIIGVIINSQRLHPISLFSFEFLKEVMSLLMGRHRISREQVILDFIWSFSLEDHKEILAQQAIWKCDIEKGKDRASIDIMKLKDFQNAYICLQYRSRVDGIVISNFVFEREYSREELDAIIFNFIRKVGIDEFKKIAKETISSNKES